MLQVLVSLGANMPFRGARPGETILAARSALLALDNNLVSSGLWASPAWPDQHQPPYVNACVRIATSLRAREVLGVLQNLEAAFGRRRVHDDRWAARTLDLDIIDYGGETYCEGAGWDSLIRPHPRAHERAFVLTPLRDVAPRWRHPSLGLTVWQLLSRLSVDERRAVRRLSASGVEP